MRGNRRQYIIQFVIWMVLMASAIFLLPNVSQLIRDKGQTKLPSSANSQVANVIQDHWGRGQNNTRQVVVVFNNGDKPLTTAQNADIDATINKLKNHKSDYYIKSMTAASDNAAAKKQLISKDKSTQLVQLLVSKKPTVTNLQDKITAGAKTTGVKSYVTGGDILNNDFSTETEKGIQKTEIIAVIFIFLVLVFVFRSPIVPLISLLGVGVSFIISLSLVMNLVDKFDFPLSNFTQVFMVVVLFGIGTDYNILLFDQFKEELSNGRDPVSATKAAVRIAGKTILYSGSSVLIGFTTLGLANFSIYRSAVGVAVGVAVLLLVLLTMNPFFMAILGKRMFWPTRNFGGGSTSKMWHGLAKNSVLHPIISLLVVLAATLPFIFDANQQLNYDTTAELSPDLPSMIGFRTVQKHFSEGTAEPTTLYVKSDKKLNNEASLKEIDRLTRKLQSVSGVKTVASITQPGGSAIEDLYVKNQLGTVTGGMKDANKGLSKISNGLDSANDQLKGADTQKGVDGAKKLADGTAKAVSGSKQLGAGANQLSSGAAAVAAGNDTLATGAGALATGAVKLNAGAVAANTGAQQLSGGASAASSGAQKLNSGLLTYTNGVYTVNSGLNQLNSKTGALSGGINQLADGSKRLATGAGSVANGSGQVTNGLGLLSSGTAALPNAVQQLFSGSSQVSNGLGQLNSKTGQLSSGTQQLSNGAGQVAQGASKLAQGTGQVSQGTQSLSNGLNKLNSQNDQLVNSTTQFSTGVAGLQAGSQKLAAGLSEMNAQLSSGGVSQEQINQIKQLQAGLTQVNAGINKLDQSFSGIQAPDVNSIQSAASSMNDNSKKIGSDYAGLQSAFNGLKGQIDAANKATGSSIDGGAVANAANGKLGDKKLSAEQYTAVVDAVNAQKGSQSKTNIDYGATQNAVNSLGGDLSGLSSAGSNLQKQLQQLSAMSSKLQELQAAKGSLDQLAAGSNKALPGASSALDSLLNGTKTMQSQVQGALTNSNGLIAGANKINDGLSQLNAGSSQLQNGIKRYTDGVSQAATGANTVNSGANSLNNGANSVNAGANKVASGANNLNGQVPMLTSAVGKLFNGANQVSGGLGKLNGSTGSLSSNVNKLYNGSKSVTAGANQVASGNATLNNGVGQMQQQVPVLVSAISMLDNGTNRLAANSGALTSGAGQLASGTGKLATGAGKLANGTSQLADGTGQAVSGANKLNAGATTLAKGSSKVASGSQTLAGKTGELASGLTTINNGQQAMYSQLGSLVGQMAKLEDGLTTMSDGTKKVNTGVGSANSYLTGLKNSDAAKEYYVPNNILKGGTYKQAIDNYLSGDDKAAKFTIVLDTNPASKASMAKMDVLRNEVANNIKGTPLAGSTVALGGQTSQTNDTQKTASSDFLRTAAIMLAGILLALMFITRSILQPFYIIGTLLLAYVSSLSLTRLLSGLILHQNHLTWNTPFFSFIMLIALGVDYSIFLMMKYREFDNASATPANRIIRASGVIGAVVLSAALILSGTFAALMPSGVLTLIQVAMAVIIGLIILVVIIPMVIPSLIKLTYPLTDRMENDNADEETRSNRH